jgi:hypothetical protein
MPSHLPRKTDMRKRCRRHSRAADARSHAASRLMSGRLAEITYAFSDSVSLELMLASVVD